MNTPLHFALLNRNYLLSDKLIAKKADQEVKNMHGMNPWQYSRLINNEEKDFEDYLDKN